MKTASSSRRSYHSAVREHQAEVTRRRILGVAERLLIAHGYTGTTIGAIAREAGVATQTVYAAFGTKANIVLGILELFHRDEGNRERYARAKAVGRPEAIIRVIVNIVCDIYTSHNILLDRLRDAFATTPELLELVKRQYLEERELLRPALVHLAEKGHLRPGLDTETGMDILWAMISVPMYLHLVMLRQWPVERYADWLTRLLVQQLLDDTGKTDTPVESD